MGSSINTVGVIGTGVIGSSWTALFLAHGLQVFVSDPAPGAEEKLAVYLKETWPVLERTGLAPNASLANYKFVGASLDDYFDQVDFVQENAPEHLQLKQSLFATIDAKTRSDVVIASSSSGLPSSKFVANCKTNPGRVLIGHPFNPPHLMPLVEVVPHPGTASKFTDQAVLFYQAMGKKPVVVKKETPGFVANRLQAALGNEAYSLVQRGVVTAEELDTTVTTGVGLRWSVTGPYMCNILGGGGGKGGFRHLLEHLGPGITAWTNDMNAHAFKQNADSVEKLDASVQQWLGHADLKAIEAGRDSVLIDLVKLNNSKESLK